MALLLLLLGRLLVLHLALRGIALRRVALGRVALRGIALRGITLGRVALGRVAGGRWSVILLSVFSTMLGCGNCEGDRGWGTDWEQVRAIEGSRAEESWIVIAIGIVKAIQIGCRSI